MAGYLYNKTLEPVKKVTGTTKYIDADGQKKPGVYTQTPAAPSAPKATGYTKYNGGNSTMDSQIAKYSSAYAQAKDKGDVEGMRAANDAANQIRNQYGYAAEYADKDIEAVKQQTGYYSQGSSGGSSGGGSMDDALSRWEQEQARIREEQEAAKRAAVERAVGQLSGQKDTVEQNYADLYRQLYINRRMAEKNLPQQMAAMGYTGGLTESSALQLQTGYADALRQGEQQKITDLSGIDRAITDTRLQGDISIAEQAAQLAQQGFSTYADLMKSKLAQQNWEKEFTYGQGRDQVADTQADREWAYKLRAMSRQELLDTVSREDVSYERKIKAAQYLYENTGDASLFSALGYSPEQIAAMGNSYAAALAQAQTGRGSGGGGGSSYKPALSYSQTMEAINAGQITPGVLEAYEYYNKEPYQQQAETITDYSQLGERAKQIISMGAHGNISPAFIADMVKKARDGKEITDAESEFILQSIGF